MFHKSFYSTLCNIFKAFIAVGVASVNGIIQAIHKHIAGNGITRVCARITIRINKPMILRVIVSTLQVVEPRLGIIIISAIPERVDLGQSTGAGHIAPCIIFIGRDRLILKAGDIVDQLYHVALQVQDIVIGIEGSAIRRILECKRPSGFIIDEINRGEISKIFGELFFAIDPGYRGKAGEISTQYSNLHSDPGEKFYVPENVYIIGTMNDIDRSVDSFDFAMRRRFRFVELRADERLEMLASLENEELEAEAIRRMAALNKAIAEVEDLNENYQIGASYFLKLKTLDFDQLWTDYLQPLLQEYIQGMYDEEGIMNRFARAYGYQPARGDANEAQG